VCILGGRTRTSFHSQDTSHLRSLYFLAECGALPLRRQVYPPLYPLSLLIFCGVNLLGAPIGRTFSSTRRYFLACLARSALAPLFEVTTQEQIKMATHNIMNDCRINKMFY
jgi:hypothetical protein